eukprot:4651689-Alexandrium_andersonii.AAC.1
MGGVPGALRHPQLLVTAAGQQQPSITLGVPQILRRGDPPSSPTCVEREGPEGALLARQPVVDPGVQVAQDHHRSRSSKFFYEGCEVIEEGLPRFLVVARVWG